MEAPPSEPTPRRSPGRNLRVAIASGVALACLFIATLLAHPLVFLAFIAVLAVIALLELDVAFREHGLRPATPLAVGSGAVMLVGTYVAGPSAQSLGLVLLVLGTLAWILIDTGRRRVVASLGATLLMTLWVPFLVSFVGLLLLRDNGIWLVMAVVALSVTNDIGAFAFGIRFGRHKLAPSVSPAKTWEGFAGGMATTLVVSAAVTGPFVPGFDMVTALVVAAGVGVASPVGDLAESLVKRDLGVKDLGKIIPGHGGIMDRADAVIFALPTAHLLLLSLGL